MKNLIRISAVVMALMLVMSVFAFSAAAEKTKGKSLTIKFDSPSASRELALDRDLEMADYYIFNASYAGIWNTGVVGYDEAEKCLYATSAEGAAASNVLRFHIEAKDAKKFIDGNTYRYAKVTYKLAANLAQGATYTIQFRDAAWYSAPINIFATPNEWHEDPVDLRTMKAWMSKDTYDIGGGDVRQNVGGGLGNDVATNGIMIQIETAYGNFAGAKLYVKSITFYEKKEDAFPEEESPSSAQATSTAAPVTSTATVTSDTATVTSAPETTEPTSVPAATVPTSSTAADTSSTYSHTPNTSKPSYVSNSSDGNLPLIIAIIVGSIIIAAGAVACCLILVKAKKPKNDTDDTKKDN